MRDLASTLLAPLRRRPAVGLGLLCGAAVAATGVAALVLGVLYEAVGDVCDPLHESPNTPIGWAIALLATGITLGLAFALSTGRARLLSFGVVIAQGLVLWWLIAPGGSC